MAGININVGIDGVKDVQKELGKLDGGLKDLSKSTSETAKSSSILQAEWVKVGASLAGAAAVAGIIGKTLWSMASETAAAGEEFLKLSKQTGISVESLSALKYAAELSETNIQAVAFSLGYLSKQLVFASTESSASGKALDKLGISAKDSTGKLKPMEQLLMEISDAFQGMSDKNEMAAVAMALFGRSGKEMISLLLEGSKSIKEMMEKAKQLGLVFSEDAAKAADKFGDNLITLKGHVTGLKYEIGNALIPSINRLMEVFLSPETLKMGDALKGVEFRTKTLKEAIQRTNDELKTGQGDTATLTSRLKGLEAQLKALEPPTKKVEETNKDLSKATKEVEDIYKKLEVNLKANTVTAKALGVSFDKNKGDTEALQSAIKSLIAEGVSPADMKFKDLITQLKTTNVATEAASRATKQHEYDLTSQRAAVDNTLNGLALSLSAYSVLNIGIDKGSFALNGNKEAFNFVTLAAAETGEEHIKLGTTVDVVTSAMQTAVQGVASAIKGLWHGTITSANDAWLNSLDVFVDVMAQMLVSTKVTTLAMKLEMAAATSGISLLIGFIASVFGGGGGGGGVESTIEKSTKAFLKSIKDTLISFEEELLGTLSHLINIGSRTTTNIAGMEKLVSLYGRVSQEGSHMFWFRSAGIEQSWEALKKELGSIPLDWQIAMNKITEALFDNLENIKDAAVEEYNIRKRIADDTIKLYTRQQDFLKSMSSSITGVKRDLLTAPELFEAQLGDIEALKTSLAGLTGEKKLTAIEELRQAYLDAWGNAKRIYEGDVAKLAEWQSFTVRGLEELQAAGKTAYDKLIDVNLEILGVQRTGLDIETQMLSYTKALSLSLQKTLALLATVGTGGVSALTPQTLTTLIALLRELGLTTMATGGIVTKPTFAMIGEAGPEAVIPLSQAGSYLGGGGTTVQNVFYGPVIWDEISSSKFARDQSRLIAREQRRYV